MKHADKVINLMGAFPGKQFKMNQIVRYISPKPPTQKERDAIRMQVRVVLKHLHESGCVEITKGEGRTSPIMYSWKTVSLSSSFL